MITNIHVLNKFVNDLVNLIIKTACEETQTGSYRMNFNKIAAELSVDSNDIREYRSFILHELKTRTEIIDVNLSTSDNDVLELFCNGLYCPQYVWQSNSSAILGMSKEAWELSKMKTIEQPLDISRMAEVGNITLHALIEENKPRACELLNETLNCSPDELIRLGLDPKQIFGLLTQTQ